MRSRADAIKAIKAKYSTTCPPYCSDAIEKVIVETKGKLKCDQLAALFENCFPNTLDTTITVKSTSDGKPDTFVITGDIDAMWLRDSSAQVWPYLPYAAGDDALTTLFRGLIGRQARCILLDPYANAFMRDPKETTSLQWTKQDDPGMKIPGVAEHKWELDSLCYPIRLAHGYWKATGDNAPFDDEWRRAMRTIVDTFKEQQRKKGDGPYRYPYGRENGIGAQTNKVGMIHSGFRPSDDPCTYPFLIPSNLFAVASLRQLAEMGGRVGLDDAFRTECLDLAEEVDSAVAQYGKHRLPDGTLVWAYEVDGRGNTLFMDDANVPGLLGLPYLACETDHALYQATRTAVWSSCCNEYFYKGSFEDKDKRKEIVTEGIGSPHGESSGVGKDWIWPMSLIVRALTSADDVEIMQSLNTLRDTTAGTGLIHESFHKDDPSRCTRDWFAWANTLFGELVLDIVKRKPKLVVRPVGAAPAGPGASPVGP
jgi:uncharacterized protein